MTPEPELPLSSDGVIVECELDAKPETVWRALTVPAIVAEWLWPNTLVPEIGACFTLERDAGEGGAIACEVIEAEPHRRLAYTWRSHEGDASHAPVETWVAFELTETQAGRTHLRVVHSALLNLPRGAPLQMGPARRLSELRPGGRRSDELRKSRADRLILSHRVVPRLLLRRAA